jgi:Cystatin domain
MNFSLSLIVAMALFIMATGQFIPPYKLGGSSPVNPTDPKVLDAAAYAFSVTFEANTHTFKVISGTSKIVAGTMYDLKVAVTEKSKGACKVINYVVWNKADQRMTVPYELKTALQLNDSC